MAYAIAHVRGVLVEQTLLPLLSMVGFWTSVGNPCLTGLWKGCPSLGNNVSFAIAAPTAFGTIYGTLPIFPRCCELHRCCVRFDSEWSANRRGSPSGA